MYWSGLCDDMDGSNSMILYIFTSLFARLKTSKENLCSISDNTDTTTIT